MANNTLSTRIAIEGAEEIARILSQLGEVGEKAFEQVAASVTEAVDKLRAVSDAVRAVENSIARVGEAGRKFAQSAQNLGQSWGRFEQSLRRVARNVTIVSGVITGAAASVALFIRSSAQAADEILKTSQALGLSVEAYQRLGFAARQAGVDQQQFARGVARLSELVQKGVQEQGKALFEFASGVTQSMNRARRGLIDVASQSGVSLKFVGDVARNLKRQLEAQGINIPLEAIFTRLLQMARGTAEARKQFEQLASGGGIELARTALQRFGLQSETSGNALRKLGIQLIDLGTGKARSVDQILGDLADRFAKMPDGIQKTALAAEIFGQRIGPRLIPFLNQGRAGIRATMDEFSRATTGFTAAQAKAAEGMNDAFSSLFTTFRDVRNQLSAPLFGPLEVGAKSIQAVIQQNRRAFEEFGQSIAQRVIPIINDFILLIQGRTGEIQNSFIAQLPALFQQAGAIIQGAVRNVIIPAFNAIMTALNEVAGAINTVFGTELTGAQIGIALVIGKILGLFGLLLVSLKLVAATAIAAWATLKLGTAIFVTMFAVGKALVVTLAALVGLPALIVAAFIALGVAVILQWDRIRDAAIEAWNVIRRIFTENVPNAWQWIVSTAQSVWDSVKTFANEAWEGVRNAVTSRVVGAWQWIADEFNKVVVSIKIAWTSATDFIVSKIQAMAGWFDTLLTKASALWELVGKLLGINGKRTDIRGEGVGQFAQGGRVFGPGSSKSDSIPAWLSSGEFVINAEAVRKYGAQLFQSLNAMRFAAGGWVDSGFRKDKHRQYMGPMHVGDTVVRALLDTGATNVVIPFSVAEKAGIDWFKLRESTSSTAGGLVRTLIGALPVIVAGIRRLLDVVIIEDSKLKESLLGMSFLNSLLDFGITKHAFIMHAAQGGAVNGPGTSTSDSILARLSTGEYVVRAAAVQKYGTSFFDALNRMRLPKDWMPQFNMGGLVESMNRSLMALTVPTFADGGLVPEPATVGAAGAARNLGTLTLKGDGGQSFKVMTDTDTVDRLQRYAIRAQVLSAGRKPSSY